MIWIARIAIAAATMGVLDAIWLRSMLPTYRRALDGHLLERPRPVAAGIFYVLYVAALVVLVLVPAQDLGWEWWRTALQGAVLGAAAYGTYDLTNRATLDIFPTRLVVIDMAWGTVLTTVVATLASLP